MTVAFKKATREKARLRLAITAPSGAGKTMGALLIAKSLGGRTAVIDTERGSASLYAAPIKLKDGSVFSPPEFDTLDLAPPYTPERFIEAINAAAEAGYDNVIVDSASHEWNGSGGCLEINEALAKAKFQGNTWSAWSETTPRHRKFLDALVGYPGHVIACMRSTTETAQEKNGAGKTKVVKLGMKSEQRAGVEFEFTVVLDLVHDGHYAVASKDRTGIFMGIDPSPITEATGLALKQWLESGADPLPAEPVFATADPDYITLKTVLMEHCDTKDALLKVWDVIAADCRASGNRPIYDALLVVRNRVGLAITEETPA
jgi:hypothetical protein